MSNHAPSTKQPLIILAVYTVVIFSMGLRAGAVIWG